MSNEIIIVISDDNGTCAPLYHKYPVQTAPQRAYLEFNPEDEGLRLKAYYDSEIGASYDIHSSHTFRFYINPCVLRSELESLARNAELHGLLTRLLAGLEVICCSRNKYYHVLTSDANEAWCEIGRMLEGLDTASVWDVDDWITPALYVKDILKAGNIREYAYSFQQEASNEKSTLVYGNFEEAVASWLAAKLENHISTAANGSEDMLKAAKILSEYSLKYQELLDEYLEKFC